MYLVFFFPSRSSVRHPRPSPTTTTTTTAASTNRPTTGSSFSHCLSPSSLWSVSSSSSADVSGLSLMQISTLRSIMGLNFIICGVYFSCVGQLDVKKTAVPMYNSLFLPLSFPPFLPPSGVRRPGRLERVVRAGTSTRRPPPRCQSSTASCLKTSITTPPPTRRPVRPTTPFTTQPSPPPPWTPPAPPPLTAPPRTT